MKTRHKLFSIGTISVFAALFLGGCTTNRVTEPARTATEQLLLSTAADRALRSAEWPEIFTNRNVFVDVTYFDSYDSKYAIGTIRDALSRAGARLQGSVTNSDIIIEVRSGGLSVDRSDGFFGIPKMPLPIPLTGTLETPEVALYKSHTERSVAKIALLAFSKATGAHIYSSGRLDGNAYDKSHSLFFVSWVRTDVPEKQPHEEKSEPAQTWSPQYDPGNLPGTNGPSKQ